MKNTLSINNGIAMLLVCLDDGSNRFFINDTEIPSSSWVGSGTYTYTSGGVTFVVNKIADTDGNIMLIQIDTYEYSLIKKEDHESTYGLSINGTTLSIIENGGSSSVTIPKGDKGDTGNGIASTTLNADYTLTITYTDGTSWTSTPIRGATGPQGPQGPQGSQGPAGDDGTDGITPSIQATATVDSNVGTPSVTVTRSGTDANPSFAFAFSNIKGETGATGATGSTGPQGPKGETGNTGAAAGFGTPTASVDSNTGTPSVSITSSGPDTAKIFNFAFHNLKGEKGEKGDTGSISNLADATVDTIDTVTTEYPDVAAGDKVSTLFGKIKKYLSDLKSKKQDAATAITTSNIESQSVANATKWNNLTDDNSTLNTTDTWIPVYASGKMQHTLRDVRNATSYVDWNATATREYLATLRTLAFWNGAYNSSGSSNFQYCDRGRFGTIVTKASDDVVGTYTDNTFYKVTYALTFKGSNNALVGGGKGNYVWAISAWSDSRLKKNIKDSEVNALDLINKIQMREFDFKDEKYGHHEDIGYVAHELREIVPECVVDIPISEEEQKKYDTETLMQVEDKHLIKYLVKALQELSKEVNEQQKQINELKDLIKGGN